MSRLFAHCVDVVLHHEGGYVNDPRDPGGETRWGISKRAYPSLDIAKLSREDAIEIYRRDYWMPLRCDDLPAGVALVAFDCAVNQGVGFAARCLQQALGVTVDRVIGPQTIGAAARANQGELINEMAAHRGVRYGGNPNVPVYGLGWFRRLFDITARAHRLAVSPP